MGNERVQTLSFTVFLPAKLNRSAWSIDVLEMNFSTDQLRAMVEDDREAKFRSVFLKCNKLGFHLTSMGQQYLRPSCVNSCLYVL